MKKGKHNLSCTQELVLLLQRLLDLDDDIAAGENLFTLANFRSSLAELLVGNAAALSGTGLDA